MVLVTGKAQGRRSAIYFRSLYQSHLRALGNHIDKNAGKILFVAIIVLGAFCVLLKNATITSKIHQLWIQEGGRLEQELDYTQRMLGEIETATHQLLIQTPTDPNASVLNSQALLTHLDVLQRAASVKIDMFKTTWSLRDICSKPAMTEFDEPIIANIVESLVPCSIISPLDCFWEGSKLLGPEYPSTIPGTNGQRADWTSLNPQAMLAKFKQSHQTRYSFDLIEQLLKGAGISSGYTEKPCLNPYDPLCPDSAPNKRSKQPVDVGAELTGGCYGYAAKYMHWPEELIVGKAERNRSRHLKRAKALQTVIQLMSDRELFASYNGDAKTISEYWTAEKAAEVLNAWQRKFMSEVTKTMTQTNISNSQELYAFSSTIFDDIFRKYSNPDRIALCIYVVATLVYGIIVSMRWKDPIRGQSAVVIAGITLIGTSTAAGLGLCALLGRAFNAGTTQVVPFLAVGLGVDHIFVLTNAYGENKSNEPLENILKKAGPTILLSAFTTIASFFAAGMIPIPALKVFCIQSAIVMCFNLAAAILVFPALISLDLRRRKSGRTDVFCCFLPPWKRPQNLANGNNNYVHGSERGLIAKYAEKSASCFSLSTFAYKHYASFVMQGSVKFFGMLIFMALMGFTLFNIPKLQDGLDLYDLVPKNTLEHKFLRVQSGMFSFYSMHAVTQGDFEYPTNQKLLYEYHDAFVRVPQIIKNDNGGLPDFWLTLFRDWLLNLQNAFDRELKEGKITQETWSKNASGDAILGYKLLVQTGYMDNPIDKSLIRTNRLVDSAGIINPNAFYNYLTAWAKNDVFPFSASQANLRPEPRPWNADLNDFELTIPKSSPLTYTQLPFYLQGLSDTNEIRTLITTVRDLCEKFEARGLPNYPSGIPFIFWEQYITLRAYLALILLAVNAAIFVSVCVLLLSWWAATLVCFNAVVTVIQLITVMILLDIKLSAIPAVILVLSVGISVHSTVHVALGFITSVGNRDRRVRLAIQSAFAPIIHSTITSLLGVGMLSTSPFEFIVRHFFWLLLSVLIISFVNGLFFFPILLALLGPDAELVPLEYPDRISTPSPPTYRQKRPSSKSNNHSVRHSGNSSYRQQCNKPHHYHKQSQNEPAQLTTITEEQSWKSSSSSMSNGPAPEYPGPPQPPPPQSNKSYKNHHELQSIVVQPEVIVETTQNPDDSNTTKVTATANIKVELVAPGRLSRSYGINRYAN